MFSVTLFGLFKNGFEEELRLQSASVPVVTVKSDVCTPPLMRRQIFLKQHKHLLNREIKDNIILSRGHKSWNQAPACFCALAESRR